MASTKMNRVASQRALLVRYQRAVRACAVMNLRQAARVITAHFDDHLRPTGLRATQLNLLMAIEVATPLTVTNLAEILAMDRTTLSRNLTLLRNRGLVETGRIALTERGRQAAAQALPIWEQAQKQITGALGDDRWDALLVELAATKATVRTKVSRHKR